jgi:hypothetical protein
MILVPVGINNEGVPGGTMIAQTAFGSATIENLAKGRTFAPALELWSNLSTSLTLVLYQIRTPRL